MAISLSFLTSLHHQNPYVTPAMLSHPRIGILGSLIKGLPDLWPRINDETAFGHFFDLSKNILKYHYRHLRFVALGNNHGLIPIRHLAIYSNLSQYRTDPVARGDPSWKILLF